ncbi:transposable element Tcb2 transposase [Trichonephila clavipes]|nr:transposable element Tcb2 transposase [Trichonephila clavipes]
MPGKRARRHFSQLSEFESGLIIGMKTAGWSTRHVAGQSDQEDHEERGSKDRAGSTCGPHSESFNDTSRHWQKVVFSDESRFVLGTDGNRVRVWRRPGERYNYPHTVLRHTACSRCNGLGAITYYSLSTLIVTCGTLTDKRYFDDILRPHTLPWPTCSPDFSPVEHVWDQLKRQMPSCHSVHELELAVQDLWAHLPQDNIRCPINSMPDRVAACIKARGGPTRY